MSEIKISKLKNGLRIITDSDPESYSVAVGIWAGVGTRNEDLAHNGVAHMVEHMLFKGTKKRSPLAIAEEIENVGGHMNAYTSKEMTAYYIHLLKDDLPLALDVLADIYLNAILPEDEIERERHVILQEIGQAQDTPDDLIFDNYYEAAYPGQGLGVPILGRAHNISRMQKTVMQDYIGGFYTAGRTIIAAAGNLNHDVFVKQVEDLFGGMNSGDANSLACASYQGGDHRQNKSLEQAHVVLGFEGLNRLDDDYATAQVLSTVLGGGMSSRLFQEVREKRGLVYSIYSFHSGYIDSGQFGIYAGTGPKDLKKLVPVVCDEILSVTQKVTSEELRRAKAQIKAALLIGRESMLNRAEQQAKYLHYKGKAFDIDKTLEKMEAIGEADIKRVAKRIFSGRPTLASLGPVEKLESYEKVAARLAA